MKAVIVAVVAMWAGVAVAQTEELRDSLSKEWILDCGNGVEMKLVLIPDGEFMMGGDEPPEQVARKCGDKTAKAEWFKGEQPQHRVRISRPFYMGMFEVTQAQFEAVVRTNPSNFKGSSNPVERVSWNAAQAFCRTLSAKTGQTIRLPTEAEWEYACRGGTVTPFYFCDTISTDQANYDGNYVYGNGRQGVCREKTMPVGSFSANTFGLYDMHGNVWELCQDRYDENYYRNSPAEDPRGPRTGQLRVLRGGSWCNDPWYCRSEVRDSIGVTLEYSGVGFRVVCMPRRSVIPTPRKTETTMPGSELVVTTTSSGTLLVPKGFSVAPGTGPEPYTKTGWAKEIVHEKTGIEMVFIPAGEFMMGSPDNETNQRDNEGPQHRVRITNPFYMGKYEVTREQWQRTMGNNPNRFNESGKLPVMQVSWNDCQEFVGRAGAGLRLPTEAQWEYACRGGTRTRFYSGDADGDLDAVGWHTGNSGRKIHEVGGKRANVWGLYDMHGNVWEWCQDWYDGTYYENSPTDDPQGPATGQGRVLRGGSWSFDLWICRSADRGRLVPEYRGNVIGFRVVCAPRP